MNTTKYETNFGKGLFFHKTNLKNKSLPKRFESMIINIYPEIQYQEFLGFGGAITESAGYCYSKLSDEKKKNFIKDYYSCDGLNYSFARLPIGSCDFSLKPYSYAKKHDLSDFSIDRDKEFILPLLKNAINYKSLSILASPWSPPRFMKNTKLLSYGGKLLTKYRQTYADYLTKYIEAYKNEGVNISYLTIQNEPNAIQKWESCLFDAEDEANFIINYLYPVLKYNNLDTKLLIWDHNKDGLFNRALKEFSVDGAFDKIAGLAYHYYSGNHFENLSLFKEHFPDKLLIHSEGCCGLSNPYSKDEFHNGEIYAHDIIGDLNSGCNAYIDWNIFLDYNGGPNHKRNYCNSPILLNRDQNGYVRTSSYFYIGHFSKFILPGARRLGFSKYSENIEVTAFKNTNNSIAIVILNKNSYKTEYNICINDSLIHDTIEGNSILSYLIEV